MNTFATRMLGGLIASTAFVSMACAEEAKEHRQLGAHVHGQGTLNVAIEGSSVEMELIAPGMDLVGFEHPATSDDQKAKVAKATAVLTDALSVFKLPAAAGCKVDAAKVESRKEEHHDGDHDDDDDHDHDHDHGAKDEHAGHSEFHATYKLTCQTPESLTAMETSYFASFAGAQALNVNVTSSKGQTQVQLTRERTTLDLTGVI